MLAGSVAYAWAGAALARAQALPDLASPGLLALALLPWGARGLAPLPPCDRPGLSAMGPPKLPRVGLLFNHDWDVEAFARLGHQARFDSAGFDLLSFPSNAAMIGVDLLRFAARQARRGQRRGWAAVLSHHEQFGALAAALVAEHLGLPGATSESILAAQHKLHARRVLQAVAPEANINFQAWTCPTATTCPRACTTPPTSSR